MSDILWQTFNDTYTKFHSQLFIQPSFNNYSDKHFWKMIYNILIKILQYIHSNYERYMMNKLSTNFQQTFNTSCITNFQHIMHHKLSTHHESQTFNKSFADLSQQIEWQIFHHIIHHDKLVTSSTQLQHNFNTSHTSSQHLFQHSFHTSFNNLWNNILQHIIHHIFITNWVTKLSQHSSS